MARIIKGRQMTARYYKGREVLKEYKQGRLVYEKSSSIPDYLCFTALEAGTFTLTIPAAVTPTYLSYVEWSKDGRTWNHRDNTSEAVTIDVQVAQGDKVYWRGSGNRCTADTTVATSALNVSSDARFDASGHLLSILKGDDYENVSGVQRYTFCNLFYQATALIHAHDLVLPPVGLTGVFFQLFRGCSSLVSPPASIPLTTIPAWGCRGMYYDCSSLTTPTDLIATTYGNTACTFMYRGCASLTRIATLPTVTTLVDSAQFQQMYYGCTSLTRAELYTVTAPFKKQLFSAMFYRCTNLNYIKCLYTDLSADQAFTDWLYGVSSTGTFIQAEGVTWPRGASGIPTGWVDIEKRTMPSGYKQVSGIYGNGTAKANINIGYAVNMKYDKIEVAFKQDEISNGMVLQSVPASGSANNGKCWFYNYNGSSLASKPFAIYSQKADGTQVLMTAGQIYQPLDTNPHYIEYTADGTNLTVIHNGTTKTSTSYVSDLPESCSENTIIFGNLYYKGWIFYFRNSNGNTQLADYVACVRESDNVAGFYDMVGGVFHKSDNANGLTAGEEI